MVIISWIWVKTKARIRLQVEKYSRADPICKGFLFPLPGSKLDVKGPTVTAASALVVVPRAEEPGRPVPKHPLPICVEHEKNCRYVQ